MNNNKIMIKPDFIKNLSFFQALAPTSLKILIKSGSNLRKKRTHIIWHTTFACMAAAE